MCVYVWQGQGWDLTSYLCLGKVLHANSNSFWIWMVGDQCSLYHTFNFKFENFDKKHWKIGAAYPSVESCEDSVRLNIYTFSLWHTVYIHISLYIHNIYCDVYFYTFIIFPLTSEKFALWQNITRKDLILSVLSFILSSLSKEVVKKS